MFKVNIFGESYTVAQITNSTVYCEHPFDIKPTGILYLVRVEGRTGNSFGSHDETWDVDVFSSREEAESLADRIDITYDLYTVINDRYRRTMPKGISEDREKFITETIALFDKMEPQDQGKYVREKIDVIRYLRNGVELVTSCYWQGVFERMYKVDIIELYPLGSGPKRWRDRRH